MIIRQMKALILEGGVGSWLRPPTLTVPKPPVNFCSLAAFCQQIWALVSAGINKAILAANCQPVVKVLEERYNVRIACIF